ncbi:MAG: hypothetical protein H0X45_01085 [Planctomycetes bacterium]|nr:hypothetical protein [Planctomycetota bacterium]
MDIEVFTRANLARYDTVIISKAFDARARAVAADLRARSRRVIYDICDNYFIGSVDSPAANAMSTMLACATRVVVSTATLRDVIAARTPSTTPIAVIGDAIEVDLGVRTNVFSRRLSQVRLARLRRSLSGPAGRLVWFGNHSGSGGGGMEDLAARMPDIVAVARRHPASLTVISNSSRKYRDLIRPNAMPTSYLPWHPITFLEALRAHDVALIPIRTSEFTRCKSANRPAQALACGLAVVADAIPSYAPFASCAEIGADWSSALTSYLRNSELRRAHVSAAASVIATTCSPRIIADQWRTLLEGP